MTEHNTYCEVCGSWFCAFGSPVTTTAQLIRDRIAQRQELQREGERVAQGR